ncbi:MAG: ABC transporter permease [Clostridiales bacterium]|nr:ABC transporter permease [Clostridiales bacterium]
MRKLFTIFGWEIRKLFSSWRRTFTLFLLPAVFLVGMLNVFPLLINYMSTGTLTKKPVTVVNAPESFVRYIDETLDAKAFTYDFKTLDEFKEFASNKTEYRRQLKKGMIVCLFISGKESLSFDEEVSDYYKELTEGNAEAKSNATVYIGFDANSLTSNSRAGQFKEAILEKYQGSLIEYLGGDFAVIGSSLFVTDTFNPVTKFLDFRTVANSSASRVVSGVLMIMMYYTTYSLVIDMFASERDRGFMDKLILTPVSRKKIYAGKILAINIIVTFSTCITMILLFLSSWLNRNNDAMSLLPFGMMLTPDELLIVLFSIPVTVFLMTAVCVSMVFSLKNIQDITVNLQLPLIYFLGDFFLQMFRGTRPVTLEYFIPVHNTLELISETFMAQDKAWHVILVYMLNLGLAIAIFATTFRKEETK